VKIIMSTGLKFKSFSAEDTFKLGEKLGTLLYLPEIILIKGNLGSGKTVLVKGIARGLDVKEKVNSPSYTLIKEYKGGLPLYNMDLYRLDEIGDLINIGFEEYIADDAIVVIEWPELARDLLPAQNIFIDIKITDKKKREIIIDVGGELKKGLLSYVNNGG